MVEFLQGLITYVIAPLGGAAVLILALSSWLGRVWASRILEHDRNRYAAEIEQLRTTLQLEAQREIEKMRQELNTAGAKDLMTFKDKVDLYRVVTVPLIDLVTAAILDATAINQFNRQRLIVHAQLGLFAPQAVLDAYDRLIDHLFEVMEGNEPYEWPPVREMSFDLLNAIRMDLGIAEEVSYRGHR